MNKSALKAAFNNLTFSARFYRAMVNTAKRGYSVDHVINRKGHACIAVRWDRYKGFTFRDRSGKIIDTKLIYNFLRTV